MITYIYPIAFVFTALTRTTNNTNNNYINAFVIFFPIASFTVLFLQTYSNLCIFIVMSMYSYCIFMYPYRASWHSSATLTEVFP
jgi:hypothetical protein